LTIKHISLSELEGLEAKDFIAKKIGSKKSLLKGDFEVCKLINKGITEKLIPAAVLIPIIERNNKLSVIFTKRNAKLKNHAGQISFPGGKKDSTDISIEQTAVRETGEEIGLIIKQSEIIGKMGTWETRTGFLITPVLAFISDPPKLKKNNFEVDEIFEVPTRYLFNPNNFILEKLCFEKKHYEFYAIKYLNYYIWGATAGLIVNLYNLLR